MSPLVYGTVQSHWILSISLKFLFLHVMFYMEMSQSACEVGMSELADHLQLLSEIIETTEKNGHMTLLKDYLVRFKIISLLIYKDLIQILGLLSLLKITMRMAAQCPVLGVIFVSKMLFQL